MYRICWAIFHISYLQESRKMLPYSERKKTHSAFTNGLKFKPAVPLSCAEEERHVKRGRGDGMQHCNFFHVTDVKKKPAKSANISSLSGGRMMKGRLWGFKSSYRPLALTSGLSLHAWRSRRVRSEVSPVLELAKYVCIDPARHWDGVGLNLSGRNSAKCPIYSAIQLSYRVFFSGIAWFPLFK